MTTAAHDHLWACYWTAQAAAARATHNTERLMHVEKMRKLALICERECV